MENLGPLTTSTTIKDAGLKKAINTTPWLEVTNIRVSALKGDFTTELDYQLDGSGRVISSRFRSQNPPVEKTSFYEHDSYGAVSSEGSIERFEPDPTKAWRIATSEPTDPLYWRMSHRTYDKTENLTRTFRKIGASDAPEHSVNKVYYSSAPPVENVKAPSSATLGLAKSGQLRSIATEAGISQSLDYDYRGQLAGYSSYEGTNTFLWHLDYDPLGRLCRAEKSTSGQSNVIQTLQFAYDALNRRILKKVVDHRQSTTKLEHFGYAGEDLVLVKENGGDSMKPWVIESQYLWGAGAGDLLMVALCQDAVEQNGEAEFRRYYFQQDRAMNVYMCTGINGDKVDVFDIASYLGFGENCTAGRISKVAIQGWESQSGQDPRVTINRTNSGNAECTWLQKESGEKPGMLSLTAAGSAILDKLAIWSTTFPSTFDVYVLDKEWTRLEERPPSERLAASVQNGKFRNGLAFLDKDIHGNSKKVPYEISLGGLKGQFIVIRWDKFAGEINVQKFELSVQPGNPGAVAFAGEWLDKETGLYYHGARYRHPMLAGKFISPDPLGFLAGDNLYAYAHNDPLTYHDPDGRVAHILVGAGIGAALGGGSYAVQCWMTGDKWSWSRFGIYTGAGALSGAAAAATFGASAAMSASCGLAAETTSIIASTAAGAAGGAVNGFVSQGGVTYVETGDLGASLQAGGKAALKQAVLGAVGGVVGGAVLGKTGFSLPGSVVSGSAGGAASGAVEGALDGYAETGTFSGAALGALQGGARGAVIGAVIAGGSHYAARAGGILKKLPDQPAGLQDMRGRGILVKTDREVRSYGGVEVQPGMARHHIKPVSLGGTDHPSNISQVPVEIHRQPHPAGLPPGNYGTFYY